MMSLPLLFAFAACDGKSATTDDTASDADTDTDADTDADSDADTDSDTDADTDTDSGLRTLDNCGGTVDDGVPSFFSRYFKCSDIAVSGDSVAIHTNGLPPHKSAYYPEDDPNHEAWDDRGGEYHQNPNSLSSQDVTLLIPLNPVAKGITIDSSLVDLSAQTSDDEYRLGPSGVAIDSVLLFNSVAAPGDDIRDEEYTFDTWSAHPDDRGEYHHHGPSKGPLAVLQKMGLITTTTPGSAEIEVYGIMCDGTVVLGCTELDGSEPDSSDFDAQNGHVHDIVDEEGTTQFTARYHTHVCAGRYNIDFTPEIQYYDTCQ